MASGRLRGQRGPRVVSPHSASTSALKQTSPSQSMELELLVSCRRKDQVEEEEAAAEEEEEEKTMVLPLSSSYSNNSAAANSHAMAVVAEQRDDGGTGKAGMKGWRGLPHLGLICAALSSLFFSLCSAIVKELEGISPFQLAACRFVGVLLPTLPMLATQRTELWPSGKRLLLLLRALLGTGSLVMQFYAIRHMPLADASVIIFSVPVFVAVFARIFLKEPCGVTSIACMILTTAGVVLIARPPFLFHPTSASAVTYRSWWGALVALGGTLLGANVYIVLRLLKGLPSPVILLNFSSLAILLTLGLALATPEEGALCFPRCGKERYLVVALGAFSFGGQILLTLALKWEQAGPVAIARTADIVFAFIWQVVFFKETPTAWSIGGAVLVTCSVLLTGLRKWVAALPPNAPARRRLGWLDK